MVFVWMFVSIGCDDIRCRLLCDGTNFSKFSCVMLAAVRPFAMPIALSRFEVQNGFLIFRVNSSSFTTNPHPRQFFLTQPLPPPPCLQIVENGTPTETPAPPRRQKTRIPQALNSRDLRRRCSQALVLCRQRRPSPHRLKVLLCHHCCCCCCCCGHSPCSRRNNGLQQWPK